MVEKAQWMKSLYLGNWKHEVDRVIALAMSSLELGSENSHKSCLYWPYICQQDPVLKMFYNLLKKCQ